MPATRIALPYLKAWRLHRLLSQDELSKSSGVAKSTLVRLENGGQANLSTTGKLATALNITRQQLVYEQPGGNGSFMQ